MADYATAGLVLFAVFGTGVCVGMVLGAWLNVRRET
jgi:hypothetical protein